MLKLTEKRFYAVPPQLLTADGNIYGVVTIPDTSLFRVKQLVQLQAPSIPAAVLEIKRIDSDTTMHLGPKSGSIDARTDVSQYTVALGSFIFAEEQARPAIAIQDIQRAVYEEEPAVAIRTVVVDDLGQPISTDNPFPVEGTITVTAGGAANPFVVNVPVPLAGTEYSVTLPKEAVRFLFRLRNASKCQISYVVGQTSTNYVTMNYGVVYQESELKLSTPLTLYFQSSKAAETAELIYWT